MNCNNCCEEKATHNALCEVCHECAVLSKEAILEERLDDRRMDMQGEVVLDDDME